VIDTFDGFRKKRNSSRYDSAGAVSDREATEMLNLAVRLRQDVESYLRRKYPKLIEKA
jgi:hypothetical protein